MKSVLHSIMRENDINDMYFCFNEEVSLKEPSNIQKKILDSYRLTDDFRKAYGEYILKTYSTGTSIRSAIQAICQFKGINSVSIKNKEHRRLIIDLIYTSNILGYTKAEYFLYGFDKIDIRDRLKYIPDSRSMEYHKVLNNDQKTRRLFKDKYRSYIKYKEYYKRDVALISTPDDRSLFDKFVGKYSSFIIKPLAREAGKGVRIIDASNVCNADRLFDDLTSSMPFICEELIVPCQLFKSIHPSSINTVRMYTYYNNEGVAKPVMSFLRAGCGGSVVDNLGAGGMLAIVDINTGIITTNAFDEAGHEYKTHPDTGFKFNGTQLPQWDELLEITQKAAQETPEVRFIGWDCALSEDRGWQIVELNAWGVITPMQIALRKGLKEDFERIVEWDSHKSDNN